MFDNLTTEGLEKAEDRLGGFTPLDSDVYKLTISNFYAGKSGGGAKNVTIIGKTPDGKEYRETIYVTNKKGENWFLNKQDNSKKVPLPGFTTVNDICLAATGKPLSDQTWEEKTVKQWDSDARQELPKAAQVNTDIIGQEVTVAIVRVLENKNEQQGNEWVPTAETRESNTIDKAFAENEGKFYTLTEAQNGVEEPVFYDGWLKKNKGQVRDNRKVKSGEAGTAGAPPKASGAAPAAGAAKTTSIFAKKS